MSIFELLRNLFIIGVLIAGGYTVYRMVWVDHVTRTTSDRASIRVNQEPGDSATIDRGGQSTDDCERYISADLIQACIEQKQ